MLKNKFLIAAALFTAALVAGCAGQRSIPAPAKQIAGLEFKERTENLYAEQFAIDRYEGGYSMIYTGNGGGYLIVPEGKSAPEGLDSDIRVINRPAENIYLAATAVMGLFDALGSGSAVRFSGSEADEWYIDYARGAMERGDMLYAGNYSEPDYELLLSEGCKLSIQSTMIDYAPEVKEKLEDIGITVITDYSSYEPHPLGRSEWIRVYGELVGKADEADSLMREQKRLLDAAAGADTGKTAAFFHISGNGQIYTRKSGDYVSKMMELAGGHNVFKSLENGGNMSAVKLEPEKFYETAKDADILIYNGTVGGGIRSVDELVEKNALFADFKAVKSGDVWCTENSMFQETMKLGAVISDFRSIFTGGAENNPPRFLYKLKGGGAA